MRDGARRDLHGPLCWLLPPPSALFPSDNHSPRVTSGGHVRRHLQNEIGLFCSNGGASSGAHAPTTAGVGWVYSMVNRASAGVRLDTTAASHLRLQHFVGTLSLEYPFWSMVNCLHKPLIIQPPPHPPLLLCLLSMSYCPHAEMKVWGPRRWSERDTIMK